MMYQREVIRDEHTVNIKERDFKNKNIDLQENNINDLVVSASRVIAYFGLSLHLQLITLGWDLKTII